MNQNAIFNKCIVLVHFDDDPIKSTCNKDDLCKIKDFCKNDPTMSNSIFELDK